MGKPRRHYATLSNLDLSMLKRQGARLARLCTEFDAHNPKRVKRLLIVDYQDREAFEGILNLLAAVHQLAKVSVMPREGGPLNG